MYFYSHEHDYKNSIFMTLNAITFYDIVTSSHFDLVFVIQVNYS